MLAQATKP